MNLDDRIALQIGRAAVSIARLQAELEEARARIAELETEAEEPTREAPHD